MSSLQRLVITSNGTALDFISQCDLKPLGLPAVNSVVDYFAGLSGGNVSGASLAWKVGCVQAVGTITIATTGPTNGQTATLFGVTWTAKTSGAAAAAEWTVSTNATTAAANLAASINGYVAFQGIVSATSLAGVVTVTAAVPGKIGNGLFMVNVDYSNATFVSLAGGTDGTAYTINRA
jgi:hypothetical protein